MAKVLLIVAPVDFRDEEAFEPKRALEERGVEVVVASRGTKVAKGKLGGELKVDVELNDVQVDEYDAVVFAGGPGARTYFDYQKARELAKQAVEKGKVLAAICIAPQILARAGLLKGKRATVWDGGDGKEIKLFGMFMDLNHRGYREGVIVMEMEFRMK